MRAARFVFGLVLIATGSFASDEAVVLMYHRFGEDRHASTSVRTDQFEAHLEYLESAGYSVVPLAAVVAALRGDGVLPDNAVAITVDDAFRSVYEEAFPRLRERGYPFTVFVATDTVDSGRPAYMTWDQMREMEAAGATFANHGSSHRSFVLWPGVTSEIDRLARVQSDIEHAERRLRQELNPIRGILAYPYGEYDMSVAGLVVDMGYVAFGQQSGAVGGTSDLRALPRFPMAEVYANIEDFAVKVATRPLPVAAVRPWDPVSWDRRPRIEVTLADTDADLDRLTCFVGGQGEVDVEWIDPGRRFEVGAKADLPAGRNRVNCTAPAAAGDRFHWFSHPWIVRQGLQEVGHD